MKIYAEKKFQYLICDDKKINFKKNKKKTNTYRYLHEENFKIYETLVLSVTFVHSWFILDTFCHNGIHVFISICIQCSTIDNNPFCTVFAQDFHM